MIQYGSDRVTQLKFTAFHPRMERRDDRWVDIEMKVELSPETPAPSELADLTVLVICTTEGIIAQIVPLDEGCDCEFQFTPEEKEQIRAFIEQPEIQEAIANTASPA